MDCLGPDGVPCSNDDRAAPCLAAGGANACPANAACAAGLGLQSNSGAAPLYTIDVFKGGNPRGSLAITDNVYDVAGVVNGVPLEILGSDIYTNLGPNAGTPGRPIEVLNFDGVPQGVPLPSKGSPGAGAINPELDLAWPEADCNGNNEPDQFEISDGTADDCNGNGIPDECEADCNNNGTADLSLRDAGGTEYATVRIMDDSSTATPRAEGEIEGSGTVTGASFGTSGTSILRLEVQQIAAGTWQISARVDGAVLLSNVSTRQPDRIELRVRRAGDPMIPFGTVSLDHVVFGAQAPCPWDCADGDGQVGIVDFLAPLGQWSQVDTSCDFDGGGVGIVDFLALLANWGACP